jgi:hypothetical protein
MDLERLSPDIDERRDVVDRFAGETDPIKF